MNSYQKLIQSIQNKEAEDLASLLYSPFDANGFKDSRLELDDIKFGISKITELLRSHKNNDPLVLDVDKAQKASKMLMITILSQPAEIVIDTIISSLQSQRIGIKWFVQKTLYVERGVTGNLIKVSQSHEAPDHPTQQNNSTLISAKNMLMVQLFVESSFDDPDTLCNNLKSVLNDATLATRDKNKIFSKLESIAKELEQQPAANYETSLIQPEIAALVRWLQAGNFESLGYSECAIKNQKLNSVDQANTYGILSNPSNNISDIITINNESDLYQSNFAITYSKKISSVLRSSNMDCILIKKPNATKGSDIFHVIVGFFYSTIYSQPITDIPIIRHKVNKILTEEPFKYDSYNAREGIRAIQFHSRSELWRLSLDQIKTMMWDLAQLHILPRVQVTLSLDDQNNSVSVLIFVPKARFSTNIRIKIEEWLSKEFKASSCKRYVQVTDLPLVRVHLVFFMEDAKHKDLDINKIRSQITSMLADWEDSLQTELHKKYGVATGNAKLLQYSNAFSPDYSLKFSGTQAMHDIEIAEVVLSTNTVQYIFSPSLHDNIIELRVYSRNHPLELSAITPLLENLGFIVINIANYDIKLENGNIDPKHIYLQYLNIRTKCPELWTSLTAAKKQNLETAMAAIYYGLLDDDCFNKVVTYTDLNWREANVLRAVAKYIKQGGIQTSLYEIANIIIQHKEVAEAIFGLFAEKFLGKNQATPSMISKSTDSILLNINKITSTESDKVFRCYLDVVLAMLRTNYDQTDIDGRHKSYISFKVDSAKIKWLPLPYPYCEIFVYSNRFEGIHLRGGKVARGGLRWSDRFNDYRYEILGLMQAQVTKNSVIIPTGAKGGFIIKSANSSDNDAFFKEGVACYKLFLCGLLDITDNIIDGKIIKPQRVICYDDNDPYLVVAADKGTASFSDYANEVSSWYKFWLGDAFASGGSQGYSHKDIGITARGAWVLAKQHLARIGIDPDTKPFTATGIGDMSGDVFGNGLLGAKCIKLVAAFNHMHIFIDPNPINIEQNFAERQRLFDLPGSKWSDYNQELLSKGGGVFLRSVKTIDITPEMHSALGISPHIISMSPDEMIVAILKAPVDLLWNGGIGTYVKASRETHQSVNNRTNDSVRINGNELRCRVVAEGGNLGFTQHARIEYAKTGGLINTDFIDNSGGVDCSDHEVNIKIGITQMVTDGLLDKSSRNSLLASITNEVADKVLRHNELQGQLIDIEESQATNNVAGHSWLMRLLENKSTLNREVEKLPTVQEMNSMIENGNSLTRPELAVLVAYAKNSATEILSEIQFIDDPYFRDLLLTYFPKKLAQNKSAVDYLRNHKLGNEIISTMLANDFINTMGCLEFHQILNNDEHNAKIIITAFIIAKYTTGLSIAWTNVENSLSQIDSAVRISIFTILQGMISKVMYWLLDNRALFMQPHSYNIQKMWNLASSYADILTEAYISGSITNAPRSPYKELESLRGKIDNKQLQSLQSVHIYGDYFDIISTFANKNDIILSAQAYYDVYKCLQLSEIMPQYETFLDQTEHSLRAAGYSIIRDIRSSVRIAISKYMNANSEALKIEQLFDKAMLDNYKDYIANNNNISSSDILVSMIALKTQLIRLVEGLKQ